MEHWLYINQNRAYEWQLNSNEEKLCAYYAKEHKWITSKIANEDGDFYCITITKLIQELPTIGKTKPNFSRALNSLADKKIFDKFVNDNNKKEVYYRFNPIYLKAWKDNNFIFNDDCYRNETTVTEMKQSVTEMKQSVTEMKQSVTEMKPIRNTNQKTNQKTNQNNSVNVDVNINNLRKEFDKILSIYPYTINNTNEKIAEALGVFMTLNSSERYNLFLAVKNYSNTENVKNQQLSKFIQSIYTFITKSYKNFIYGLPKNFTYAEKFEQKKSQVGGDDESDTIIYIQNDIDKIKIYIENFEEIKKMLDNKEQNIEDKIKKYFNEKEIDIIFVKMGGLKNIEIFPSPRLAESLIDLIKVYDE